MAGELVFEPARPTRAVDAIIAQVRDMLARGEIGTGDRLPTERVLAEQFGVSRNTVRGQLASIFTKTETSRQGELVTLLARIVAP